MLYTASVFYDVCWPDVSLVLCLIDVHVEVRLSLQIELHLDQPGPQKCTFTRANIHRLCYDVDPKLVE